MRRLRMAFVTGFLLSLMLVGSASALMISPDSSINFDFTNNGNRFAGTVEILRVESDVLGMRLLVDEGSPTGIRIQVVGDSGPVTPTSLGTVFSPGVNVADGFINGSFANFVFNPFFLTTVSDPFFVDYAGSPLAAGQQIFLSLFGPGNQNLGTLNAQIVPEPAAALMLGMGLGGLALAGRRRR